MCLFGKQSYSYENSPEYKFYEEQRQREEERLRKQQEAVGTINSFFDENARDEVYQGGYDAFYNTLLDDAGQQYDDTLNDIKVNLARRGGFGGNTDAIFFSKARKSYDDAITRASQMAEEYRAGQKARDESLRGQLLGQAFSGLDGNAAQQIATSQWAANQQNYITDARQASMGNIFSDLAKQLGNARTIAGQQRARSQFEEDASNTYFAPSGSYSGTSY